MDNATLVSTREGGREEGRVNLGIRVGGGIRRLPICLLAPSRYLSNIFQTTEFGFRDERRKVGKSCIAEPKQSWGGQEDIFHNQVQVNLLFPVGGDQLLINLNEDSLCCTNLVFLIGDWAGGESLPSL